MVIFPAPFPTPLRICGFTVLHHSPRQIQRIICLQKRPNGVLDKCAHVSVRWFESGSDRVSMTDGCQIPLLSAVRRPILRASRLCVRLTPGQKARQFQEIGVIFGISAERCPF